MSDRTRCWFGAVTGHTVPMARMAIAGMRATRLSDEDIGAEYEQAGKSNTITRQAIRR